jgi:hypothetical protein
MIKKVTNINISNLVATDGFQFSGSGLVNDIFRESGYVVPKNIRADELFYNNNNFSWPRAINNEYNFIKRFKLILNLFKIISIRFPLNIIQKTPIYNKYLLLRGRGEVLHQPTSVNRSLWSYFVSIYMVICKYNYNRNLFLQWIVLKYWWELSDSKDILIDNGIPKDKKIADWLFNINNTIGIFVYRDPRVQYQQISQVFKSTGKTIPCYDEFLCGLESQYQSLDWIMSSEYRIILISFDKLLGDLDYRNKLEVYFKKMNIMNELNYDFSKSIKNNQFLSALSKKIAPNKNSINKEGLIQNYHDLFENKLYDIIGS